jgi:hypothetical protein
LPIQYAVPFVSVPYNEIASVYSATFDPKAGQSNGAKPDKSKKPDKPEKKPEKKPEAVKQDKKPKTLEEAAKLVGNLS